MSGKRALFVIFNFFQEIIMVLWLQWFVIIKEFRPVFSRKRTFLWFVVVLIGFSIRRDLMGVTSFIRALGIKQESYDRILGFFNSNAVTPDRLAKKWVEIVLKFVPGISRENGRILLVADGIKISKSGRNGGKVVIEFYSKEELESIFSKLKNS